MNFFNLFCFMSDETNRLKPLLRRIRQTLRLTKMPEVTIFINEVCI